MAQTPAKGPKLVQKPDFVRDTIAQTKLVSVHGTTTVTGLPPAESFIYYIQEKIKPDSGHTYAVKWDSHMGFMGSCIRVVVQLNVNGKTIKVNLRHPGVGDWSTDSKWKLIKGIFAGTNHPKKISSASLKYCGRDQAMDKLITSIEKRAKPIILLVEQQFRHDPKIIQAFLERRKRAFAIVTKRIFEVGLSIGMDTRGVAELWKESIVESVMKT